MQPEVQVSCTYTAHRPGSAGCSRRQIQRASISLVHANSDLKPNAQFALGLSYGGLGDKADSVSTLEGFIKDNPKHPLVADAKQVIAEMK